jgi:hypothetical protein
MYSTDLNRKKKRKKKKDTKASKNKRKKGSISRLLTTCPFPEEDRLLEEGILLNHGVQMEWANVLHHLAWVGETHRPHRPHREEE